MLQPDRFVEVQGTGEHGTFSRAQLDRLLDLAGGGIGRALRGPAAGARLVKLLAATRSAGKQREIRRVLEPAGLEVVFPDDIMLYEERAEDLLETGDTLRGQCAPQGRVLVRRSGSAHRRRRLRTRGAFARRGAGRALPPVGRGDRLADAKSTLRTTPSSSAGSPVRRRRGGVARYRCVLVLLRTRTPSPKCSRATAAAGFSRPRAAAVASATIRYFCSDELGKTFGEATAEEKDGVSHRGRALRSLAAPSRPRGDAGVAWPREPANLHALARTGCGAVR